MAKTKRIVAVSDLHCGHRSGLTPPEWQLNPNNTNDAKWLVVQKEGWEWYRRMISRLKPVHLLLVVGDVVDGSSSRADGRDSIRQKRTEQINMGLTCLDMWDAKHIEMVYGTRYHVADWEDDICSSLGDKASIGAHGWPSVNGVVFDIKHAVGGSTIPHGRGTALLREKMWNEIWAHDGNQPLGDIILRAHVHYAITVLSVRNGKEVQASTMPALQGLGTEYGAEQCAGTVHFGIRWWDIDSKGNIESHLELADLKGQQATPTEY